VHDDVVVVLGRVRVVRVRVVRVGWWYQMKNSEAMP
jgi:hypothetical protein